MQLMCITYAQHTLPGTDVKQTLNVGNAEVYREELLKEKIASSIRAKQNDRGCGIISPGDMEDHGLEFLLAFDGRVHLLEKGYWLKFEIRRVEAEAARLHGLRYSFTLHGPDGSRLVGFDNAHAVPALGSRFKERAGEYDHWHRSETDTGRPYKFVDAEALIEDFFREVERVLTTHGVGSTVISEEER